MRIAVLGPLQVRANDSTPVVVRGPQERLLLGLLATAAPGVVVRDRLIEALAEGGARPPGIESLWVALRQLRSSLEPGLLERSSGQYVLRRGTGYALAIPRGDVDALRFADLVARGRSRLAAGDGRDAARLLSTALGLWRGEPYGDWPDAAFATAERRGLEEIRAGAEADLARAHAGGPVAAPPRTVPPVPARPWPVEVPAALPVPVAHRDPEPVLPRPAPPPPEPSPPGGGTLVGGGVSTRKAPAGRQLVLVGVLVAALAAALVGARLAARADREATQAATFSDADRLAAESETAHPLDVSLLLAAQAYRLADTPGTRGGLTAAMDGHARVERAVSFSGIPEDPILSGGGTVTFDIGLSVVGWSIGPTTLPSVIMEIPGEWGAWIVAAPSPVKGVLMGAGVAMGRPWLRMVSTLDGTSRLLLDGDELGGRPVDGAVSADGRRLLLVVAEPDAALPDDASRWQLIDVDATDGTRRDTGIGGTVPVPVEGVRADFADDGGSFVVWDDTWAPTATLVQAADGRQSAIAMPPRSVDSVGFRALPGGAARLWADGAVTLVDRAGATVQDLAVPQGTVRDIAVSPDGRWAVTGGDGGDLFRWNVDPSSGRWSGRQRLSGHAGDVVGVEVDASGQRLATVSLDHAIISWDMRPGGERETASPADRLDAACAIVGRDLTRAEWRRFLPDRAWRPTCTDLA